MMCFKAKAFMARHGRAVMLSAMTAAMAGLFCGCGGGERVFNPWSLLFLVVGGVAAALAAIGTRNYRRYRARKRAQKARRRDIKPMHPFIYAMYAVALVMLVLFFALLTKKAPSSPSANEPLGGDVTASTAAKDQDGKDTPEQAAFSPAKTADSDPAKWDIRWDVLQGNQTLETFTRPQAITFSGEEYFALNGIATFRGNSRRTSATFGTAAVTDETVDPIWNVESSSLAASGGGSYWTGSGWTGQPLIVEWPAATRKMMNLYEPKKAKDGLVEVIYATLDGHVYFLDLDDGSYTRDPLFVGMCFKGAGSLDPRGYPLMYVGAGDETEDGLRPRMFIINLIDCSIAYEYGHEDARLHRKDNNRWCAFDSSPLVDAQTDTLIWPGENGLLYTIRLNTVYDVLGKTISVTPDEPVVTRYAAARSGEEEYWYGYEASAVIEGGYLYVSENGGLFYCVDLNTMELVWAQDTKDDSNSTPVMEYVSDTEAYIYTAPSLHWTADENDEGTIAVYKLNALTGEIVWQTPFDVHTVDGVSGGVQSTPLLGKAGTDLEGLIVYTVARTPSSDSGVMVALDTKTGEEVWTMDMENYTWSSPVAVYGAEGAAYVVTFDAIGTVFLVDGKTGETLYTSSVGTLVEASPAVYNDKIVVGTRGQQIYALQVK